MHLTGLIVIVVLIVSLVGLGRLFLRRHEAGGVRRRVSHRSMADFQDPTRGFRDPFR